MAVIIISYKGYNNTNNDNDKKRKKKQKKLKQVKTVINVNSRGIKNTLNIILPIEQYLFSRLEKKIIKRVIFKINELGVRYIDCV